MSTESTKKSISSRLRITRRGKVIRRAMGVGHFRTRKSQKTIRGMDKNRGLNHPLKNIIS